MNSFALPVKFLDKLTKFIPASQLESVLNSFNQDKPTAFRVNTLKASIQEVKECLQQLGIPFQEVPWYQEALTIDPKFRTKLRESDLVKDGLIYLQSLPSMIPALILDPEPTEKVLDLAAAPGSKTSQLAALMGNSGEIIANDKSRSRIFKLEAVLKSQGVTNTKIICQMGQLLWKTYPEYFDKTLLDAPCSMEGRFNIKDSKSYQGWSSNKVKQLSQMQKFLLRSAISCTKVGGMIVYSTCTLSPEENEEVVDWILEKEVGNIEIEKIDLKIEGGMPGISEWGTKQYNPQVTKALRILPNENMEGFFVAKFRKIKSNISL